MQLVAGCGEKADAVVVIGLCKIGRKIKGPYDIDDGVQGNFSQPDIDIRAVQLGAILRHACINNSIDLGGIDVISGSISPHINMIDPQFNEGADGFVGSIHVLVDDEHVGAVRQRYYFFQGLAG